MKRVKKKGLKNEKWRNDDLHPFKPITYIFSEAHKFKPKNQMSFIFPKMIAYNERTHAQKIIQKNKLLAKRIIIRILKLNMNN